MIITPNPRDATRKPYRTGTHRWVAPSDTIRNAMRVSRDLQITRVANVTGLDRVGIPVVTVCRPNARSLAVSQGKGVDYESACASGLMEAIELYHAEHITHPMKIASFNELRYSHKLAPVGSLPRISISAFGVDLPIPWISGIDLFNMEPIWLPYELVHTNFTIPLPMGSGCFVLSSNGLASGNHILEAMNHALCEVIERDAVALFRLKSPDERAKFKIDLDTITDPNCRRLLGMYERAGILVGVWDATSDVSVSTFHCIIVDREPKSFPQSGPIEGMGSHLVREVALCRALTEAAQARLTLISGTRDDNGHSRYKDLFDSELADRFRHRLSSSGRRRFDSVPTYLNDLFEEDVQTILDRLALVGIEHAIAVDLTKPEFGIPVVRVVVPGLETYHHVQGYVAGERALRILKARTAEAS